MLSMISGHNHYSLISIFIVAGVVIVSIHDHSDRTASPHIVAYRIVESIAEMGPGWVGFL